MGEKLYPPYLENTIPAFYKTKDGAVIKVPFSMNRIVSLSEVTGFSLLVKSIATGDVLFTLTANKEDLVDSVVTFNVNIENTMTYLRVGQFYKVQLAYLSGEDDETTTDKDERTIGWYSNAAIGKCTIKPELAIDGVDANAINYIKNRYLGTYTILRAVAGENIPDDDIDDGIIDLSERVLTYGFSITDYSGNILQKTEGVHNTSEDDMKNTTTTTDECKLKFAYKYNTIYYITYYVKTINGLELKSDTYKIMDRDTIDMEFNLSLNADCYPENGFIKVNLINNKDLKTNKKKTIAGNFIILRRSAPYRKESLVSYMIKEVSYDWGPWQEIWRISLQGVTDYDGNLKDFTVEQGRMYQYAIQQYNDHGVYTNRIESNICQADFEYMFLFDGVHQLKIKYNPTVSSFKNTVLETKTDTIGSKYPFIFRNGDVKYKEFPIGGLISYLMDGDITYSSTGKIDTERYYFFDPNDLRDNERVLQRVRTKSLRQTEFPFQRNTNLTSDNIAVERAFKLRVLDWLSDGKPKLFRSPTEGNYIVRLLNVSMQPNDTLGRMIHSFQAQAYEVAEYNYDSLLSNHFIPGTGEKQYGWDVKSVTLWQMSKKINDDTYDNGYDSDGDGYQLKPRKENNILTEGTEAIILDFHDVTPGTLLELVTPIEDATSEDQQKTKSTLIQIGQSGTYHLEVETPVQSVKVVSPEYLYGSLDYVYKTLPVGSEFSRLKEIRAFDGISRQCYNNTDNSFLNVLESITKVDPSVNNVQKKLQYFSQLRFLLRPVYDLKQYLSNNSKVYDYQPLVQETEENTTAIRAGDTVFTLSNNIFSLDPWGVFKYENNYYVWTDPDTLTLKPIANYSTWAKIKVQQKDQIIDLDLSKSPVLEVKDLDNVEEIQVSPGVLLECSYLGSEYIYDGGNS